MAFTISDFEDLVRLLGEHPEWQARLRPVILGDEILSLPSRMDRVEAALEAVAQRLDTLTDRLDTLSGDVRSLAASVQALVTRLDLTDGHLGNLRGQFLEFTFEKNLGNWLRDFVRKPRKVFTDDLTKLDEAIADGRISDAEVVQVAWVDALVRAQDRSTSEEVVLAIEISTTVNSDDVERARARADVLARAGYDGRSLVVGNRVTDSAAELAKATNTAVVLIRPDAQGVPA